MKPTTTPSADRAPPARGAPLDLYRAPVIGRLLQSRVPQIVAQIAFLLSYVALGALGWGDDSLPGIPVPHPRMYTHASTLLFWVVWFMGLVLLSPLTGRAWCGVCPVGAASDWLGRRGLGLAWPRWLRDGAAIPLVFAGGVAAVVWGDVHKSPDRTALFVGAVGALAVLSGVVWRRGAFCRGGCPVGAVLRLYSRHAPLEVRPRDDVGCRSCGDRSCTDRLARWYRWDVGNVVVQRKVALSGCPVALDPPTMDAGACLLCLRCVRQCSKGNLGVFWGRRAPRRDPDRVGAALLVLLAGLVSLALLRTWPALKDSLTPGAFPQPWFSALWVGVALPVLFLLAPGAFSALTKRAGGTPVSHPPASGEPPRGPAKRRTQLWGTIRAYLPAFVGPVFGAHLAIALVKLNAKAGYIPYLFFDPRGASTYVAIHLSKTLALPDLLIPLAWLRWAALACLGSGVLAGLREAVRRWPREEKAAMFLYSVSFLGLSSILGAAVFHWLFPWGR